jgi:hypothetical protein
MGWTLSGMDGLVDSTGNEVSDHEYLSGRITTLAKSHPGVRTNLKAAGGMFSLTVIIPKLGNTWPKAEDTGG